MNPSSGDIKDLTEGVEQVFDELNSNEYSVNLSENEADYLLSIPEELRPESLAWYRVKRGFNKKINGINVRGFTKNAFIEGFRSARKMYEQLENE